MKLPILFPGRSRFSQYSTVLLIVLLFVFVQCDDNILDASSDDQLLNNPSFSQKALSSSSALPSGSLYDIQLPDEWKDLIIYNHGYVNPQKPLSVPDDEVVEGQTVADIVNQLGFAYAATSYRSNGLVGPEAVQDVRELLKQFIRQHGKPDHVYLVGVSEGALVTTLAIEQHKEFSGGIAACGPVGDFERQINYLGDFHVLFNHYFPGLIPGDPTGIPEKTIDLWLADDSPLKQKVARAINRNKSRARTVLEVADVPVDDPYDLEEIRSTIFSLLDYNILATNNANERLNGNAYDNSKKMYRGTGSILEDLKLSHYIKRYKADESALRTIDEQFETSGDLEDPLVMIHTTGDQEVPYWHEPKYRRKAFRKGKFLYHTNIRVPRRYGHCNFKLGELLTGFSIMVLKATFQDLFIPPSIFENEQQKNDFLDMAREQGVEPLFKEELQPSL